MKIVFDTNIVIASQRRLLRGPEFDTLAALLAEDEVSLHVPIVVVEEAVRRLREDLKSELAALNERAKKVGRLVSAPPEIPEIDPEAEASNYEAALRHRVEEIGGEIIDYPDVAVGDLVGRDLGRRRPFRSVNKKGETGGFRDAVIWETVVRNVVEVEQTTLLVTRNKKDFAVDTGSLHPDLVHDLEDAGFPPNRVVLSESMDALSRDHLRPRLQRLEDGTWGFTTERFNQHFAHTLTSIIADFDRLLSDMEEELQHAFPGASDASVSGLDAPSKIDWVDAYRLDEKDILLAGTGEVDAKLTFFMQHCDFHSMPGHLRVNIIDPEWNDWVSWVEAQVTLPFGVQIIYNPDHDEVVNAEITHVEIVPHTDIEEPADFQ